MKIEAIPDKLLQRQQAQLGAENWFKKRAERNSSSDHDLFCELPVQQPILKEHKKGHTQLGILLSPHTLLPPGTAFGLSECRECHLTSVGLTVGMVKKDYVCK